MTNRRTIAIALALWLLTGVYIVSVDEQAVVRRFGAVVADRVPPGLHVGFPWGIDRVDRLKVREQKRLNVGFEFPDQALRRPVSPGRREFFTGDQNLVNIELLVQYTIREPRAYLFSTVNVIETMRQAAEAAIAAAVAARPVDALLTTGKLEAQEELRRRTQETVDRYGLGVAITAVNIQAVSPPLPVADAFRDVASAREDRDRIIKEAESYANAAVAGAQGEASRMREEAIGYRDRRIREATGDAARFVQAYEAYRRAPGVTTARLYLETVEEILPRLKVIALDRRGGRSPVDLNLLPRSAAVSRPPDPENAPPTGAGAADAARPAPSSGLAP
jgi:modulator of FtsH protease HflK